MVGNKTISFNGPTDSVTYPDPLDNTGAARTLFDLKKRVLHGFVGNIVRGLSGFRALTIRLVTRGTHALFSDPDREIAVLDELLWA
jgi:hypothetical protein